VHHDSDSTSSGFFRTLDTILDRARLLDQPPRTPDAADPSRPSAAPERSVRRHDLGWGDSLLVRTLNSTYAISRAGDDSWFVWGGWFERQGETPARVRINGCTWGGSVIHLDLLAAPGLRLEFANGVTTSPIREVAVLPGAWKRRTSPGSSRTQAID
jgi:hypothetical protein